MDPDELTGPPTKAQAGRGGAVMGVARVKDVQLAGQANPAFAPVAERLHASERDPDPVGVVLVRLVGPRRQADLRPLQAGATGPQVHPDRRPAAGSFKTSHARRL